MNYKKGQIVPRSLVRCKNRKTQYLWKFGADVRIVGRKIIMLSEGSAIICYGKGFIGGKKGKPRIYNSALIKDVHIDGSLFESSRAIEGVICN